MNIYLTWIVAVGVLITTLLYSLVVHIFAKRESNSNVWSWYHRLISTAASVGLGVAITVHMFQYQQDTMRNSRMRSLANMLHAELKNNRTALETDDRLITIATQGTNESARVTLMTSVAISAALESALFTDAINNLLLTVSREMSQYNMHVRFFMSLNDPNSLNNDYPAKVSNFSRSIEAYRHRIIQQFNELELKLSEFAQEVSPY